MLIPLFSKSLRCPKRVSFSLEATKLGREGFRLRLFQRKKSEQLSTVNNLQLMTGWTGVELAVSGVINTQIIKKVDHIVKFN